MVDCPKSRVAANPLPEMIPEQKLTCNLRLGVDDKLRYIQGKVNMHPEHDIIDYREPAQCTLARVEKQCLSLFRNEGSLIERPPLDWYCLFPERDFECRRVQILIESAYSKQQKLASPGRCKALSP